MYEHSQRPLPSSPPPLPLAPHCDQVLTMIASCRFSQLAAKVCEPRQVLHLDGNKAVGGSGWRCWGGWRMGSVRWRKPKSAGQIIARTHCAIRCLGWCIAWQCTCFGIPPRAVLFPEILRGRMGKGRGCWMGCAQDALRRAASRALHIQGALHPPSPPPPSICS